MNATQSSSRSVTDKHSPGTPSAATGDYLSAMAQAAVTDHATTRLLLDNLNEGLYFVDPNRRIQFWNKAAERISGFTRDEVVGTRCADDILVHVDVCGKSLCQGDCPLSDCMRDGVSRTAEVFLRHKDGHRVSVRISTAPLRDSEGAVVGGLEVFEDATAVMSALEEVETNRRRALVCPLTGLGTSAYSETMLARRLAEARASDLTLGLLFIEVDGLQLLQTERGGKVRDVIVKMVARTLVSGMRSCDYLGRWDGDGFIAILSHMTASELRTVADHLRIRVEKSGRIITRRDVGVTVSIGARVRCPIDTVESLTKLAYTHRQRAGSDYRNHVIMFT